jgi:hypothetical protein
MSIRFPRGFCRERNKRSSWRRGGRVPAVASEERSFVAKSAPPFLRQGKLDDGQRRVMRGD